MWRAYLAVALCATIVACGVYYGHTRYRAGQADGLRQLQALKLSYAEALSKARADTQARIHTQAQRLAEVSQRYEHEKADTQAATDRLITRLRAGTERLRDEWQCPAALAVSSTATDPGQPDDAAARRERLAALAIAAGAAADAQIRGLQDALMAERAGAH